MTELGDKFLAALVGTIRDTRFDIADMRNWRPGWFPTMHSRCLSNLIHDRIWAHLVTLIASNPGTSIKVNRPGMSGDSSSWKGWGHVRWFIEEVPAGAA